MARRPPDIILTNGDLDGQPQIGGGGGRTRAARGRGPSRSRGQSGRGRAALRDRGSLREGQTGPNVCGARSSDRGLDIISPSHRHGTPSPTIYVLPSTVSPTPSGRSHEAMGAPARAPQRHNGAPPQPPQQPPFHQLASAAPQEGRGGTPHIVRFPIIIESIGRNHWVLHTSKVYARRMTKIFKRGMITAGYCWKSVPDHQKEIYWERWKAIVRAAYDAKLRVRYREYWASVNFKDKSEKALHNRKREKGGPSTGPSKHTGGTQSFRTYEDILALDKDEDDEVTPNDVFLHVHTKDHDGAKLVMRHEEHTQATPDQPIDEEQLYYDAAGEPMVRRSEFDAVVQRLAQFEAFVQSQLGMRMDFGANTSQAPPPPPSQEHHQQVGMDPACSPQQQHYDDDRHNFDWMDEEHLGDKS
ncbi:hypothetical protein Scep_014539 [Stephania cephalantha]|uniref:Uncharacterized protein n=1 Tax=Stephania cephalantha TaxID=152367 RepID=A0AAP0P0H3_9MAGN